MTKKLKRFSFRVLILIITFVAVASLFSTQAQANSPRTISNVIGTAEVTSYDDFLNPENSKEEYYLRAVDGTVYRLHTPNEEKITHNRKIKIKDGIQIGTDIYGKASMLSVNIEADPDIIIYNTSTTIKWQVEEATSCTGTGGYNGWSGPKSITGGTFSTGKLTSNQTYTITCQNDFDTITDSVTVTVIPNYTTAGEYLDSLASATPPLTEPIPYKVAVFLLNPSGATTNFTATEAQQFIFDGQPKNFFAESSLGTHSLTGKVFGWLQSSSDECSLANSNLYQRPEFVSYVANNPVHLENYDHLVFIRNCDSFTGTTTGISPKEINGTTYNLSLISIKVPENAQIATAPGSGYIIPFAWTHLYNILTHELSHAFGNLKHAKGLDCGLTSIGNNCHIDEYGNYFDILGGRTIFSLHNNGLDKDLLGWLYPYQKLNITSSGTYKINRLETRDGIKFAKIWNPNIADQSGYTVENRRAIGFDQILDSTFLSNNQTGLLINRYGDTTEPSITKLIDASPTSSNWGLDIRSSALLGSNIFSDPERGITVGPITNVTDTSITFQVNILAPLPLCTHSNPTVTAHTPFTYDISEQDMGYEISAENTDSLACGESNFKFELLPLGFSLSTPYTQQSETISPQQNMGVYWFTNNLQGLTAGTYHFNSVVTNLNYPSYQTTTPIVIEVVP